LSNYFYCRIQTEGLFYDAERDLLAIAKFVDFLLVTIRYDSVYLTCSKKLTGSQLSLPHGINKKLKCKTKQLKCKTKHKLDAGM